MLFRSGFAQQSTAELYILSTSAIDIMFSAMEAMMVNKHPVYAIYVSVKIANLQDQHVRDLKSMDIHACTHACTPLFPSLHMIVGACMPCHCHASVPIAANELEGPDKETTGPDGAKEN